MRLSPFLSYPRIFAVILLLVSSLIASTASAQDVLKKIAAIRALKPERAAEQLPVQVEGQVMHVSHSGSGFFLFDGKNGIYVEPKVPKGPLVSFSVAVGDLVKVTGVSLKGNFYPSIGLKSLEILGTAPLPEPRIFHLHELYYPSIDSDWVNVRGRLISMSASAEHSEIVLGLDMNGIEISAHLKYTEENYKRLSQLMFRLVGFHAVAGTIYNNERQLTNRIFFVSSVDDFELLQNYDVAVEDMPFYETHELLRVGSRLREMIGTEGVVTHSDRNQLYIRGPVTSLLALTTESTDVEIGDVVSLQGFAWTKDVSPAFQAISVDFVQSGPEPYPVVVTLDQDLDPRLNYELITVEAELVNIGKSFNLDLLSVDGQESASLLCRSGPYLFETYVPADVDISNLRLGARLRLTGICQLKVDPSARWSLHIAGLSLQLRSADDLEVIAAAPFWTKGRFLSVLGALMAVLVLFLIWVIQLRRQVEAQTAVIGEQVERQTILDERQRIARELHDNLEQGLAGMAIQLRGVVKLQNRFAEGAVASIAKALQLDDFALKEHLRERLTIVEGYSQSSQRALSTVQDMLKYCSEESRASILDLRGGLLERMDLPSALQVALEPLAERADVKLQIELDGAVRRMRHEAERNLFLIAREAVSNALRHAEPEYVRVHVEYEGDVLRVTIMDDGQGFDLKDSSKPGHFGLVGMRERASHLDAQIEMHSATDKGTTIKVVLEDMRKWEKK